MVNILYHGIFYGNISLEYYHPSIHGQDLKLVGTVVSVQPEDASSMNVHY